MRTLIAFLQSGPFHHKKIQWYVVYQCDTSPKGRWKPLQQKYARCWLWDTNIHKKLWWWTHDNRSWTKKQDNFVKFAFFKEFSMSNQHIFYPFPISFDKKWFPKQLEGGSPFNFSITNTRTQQSKFTLSFSRSWVRRIQ